MNELKNEDNKCESIERVKQITIDELEMSIEEVKKLKEFLYTQNSWIKLKQIVDEVNQYKKNNNLTQEEIKELYKRIETAKYELELRDIKKELYDLLNYADTITDKSMVKSDSNQENKWYNFKTIRELVRETLFTVDTTKNQDKLAIYQLKYYIDELGL